MKKRRLLKVGSAMALLFAVGLVAGCPDDQVGEDPAVEQEQPPPATAPGQPAPPPETREQPGQTPPPGETPPGQEPMMDDQPDRDMDQEPPPPPPQR